MCDRAVRELSPFAEIHPTDLVAGRSFQFFGPPSLDAGTEHAHMSPPTAVASRTAEVINPLIENTVETFSLMAGIELKRTGLRLLEKPHVLHDISAIVRLTGSPHGYICLSIERRTAFALVRLMLDIVVHDVNRIVLDASAEFANVVAGSTKAVLEYSDVNLGIPNVFQSTNCPIRFPEEAVPMVVDFTSPLGRVAVAFALIHG